MVEHVAQHGAWATVDVENGGVLPPRLPAIGLHGPAVDLKPVGGGEGVIEGDGDGVAGQVFIVEVGQLAALSVEQLGEALPLQAGKNELAVLDIKAVH